MHIYIYVVIQDIKNWIVASNIDLLSVMESFWSPKRRVWVMRESFLSNIHLSISFILLMKVNLWLEKWLQWRKKCVVDSTKFPQPHKGFIASTKLFWNLCSLRWLKPTHNLAKIFIPFVLCTLNMLFAPGLIKLKACVCYF